MDDLRAQGPRIALRPVTEEDLPTIEDLRADRRGTETLVITSSDGDRLIGVLQYRMDEPAKGWTTIDHLAVAEDSRRWGLGQDAVRLFEETIAQGRRVRHFKTGINAQQGLALYLWLRLGYRPTEFTLGPSGQEALELVRDAT